MSFKRKFISYGLAAMIITQLCACAGTASDASQDELERLRQENQELKEKIQELGQSNSGAKDGSQNQEPQAPEASKSGNQVLLDKDNIYCEYRGIYEESSESWIINLYVENKRDNEIYLFTKDTLINSCSIGLSNNGATIPAKSNYISSANFDLIIKTEDLAAYGISEINTIDFTLQFKTSLFGDIISEAPVSIQIKTG